MEYNFDDSQLIISLKELKEKRNNCRTIHGIIQELEDNRLEKTNKYLEKLNKIEGKCFVTKEQNNFTITKINEIIKINKEVPIWSEIKYEQIKIRVIDYKNENWFDFNQIQFGKYKHCLNNIITIGYSFLNMTFLDGKIFDDILLDYQKLNDNFIAKIENFVSYRTEDEDIDES